MENKTYSTKLGLLAPKLFGAGAIRHSKMDGKVAITISFTLTLSNDLYKEWYIPGTNQDLYCEEIIKHWSNTLFGINGKLYGKTEEDGAALPSGLRGSLEFIAQKHQFSFCNCCPCVTVKTHQDYVNDTAIVWFEIMFHDMIARKPEKLQASIMRDLAVTIGPG